MSVRWGAAIQKPSSNTSNSSNANEAAANSPALPVPLLSPLSFTPSPAFAPKEQSDALNSAESKNESQNVTVESHVIPVKPSEPKPARLNAVETAQRERLRREYERLNAAESKIRNENATKVQNWCLGHLQRKRALAMLRTEWDAEWSPASWNSKDAVKSAQNVMSGIIQTLKASSMLLVFYTPAKDGERLEGLVKALSDRLGSVQTSITTLFLNSSYRESVIRVLQRLCMACLERVLGKHLAGTRNSMPRKGSTTFELRFLLLFYNLDSYKLPNVARTGPSSVEISREAHERVVSFVFAGPDTGLKLSGIYEGIRDLLREQVVAAFGGSAGAKKSTANQPDVKVVALLRLVALISARSSTTNLCFGYIADSEHLNELVVCVLGGVPLVFSLVDGSTLAHFSRERVLQRSLALFASKEFEKHRDSIIARLGADGLLVLAANLVTLFRAQPTDGSGVQFGELLRTLNVLVKASHSLLDSNSDDSKTSSPTVRKKGQASTYHPLLGFVAASLSIPSNSGSVAVYQRLVSKLAWIWSSEAIGMGFARILAVFGGQGVVDAANVALLAIEAKEACEFNIRLVCYKACAG